MRIPWSISTTVRNPERLRDFLGVLKQLEGVPFDTRTQEKYQILLIKERLYRPTTIPAKHRALFSDLSKEISYSVAKEVFDFQRYESPSMRGRQSANPLNKLGFCIARETAGPIKITRLGDLFLSLEADIGYIFFKSLLKLQLPNPWSRDFSEDKGFNIRPFIALLHLVNKTKWLTQNEFSIFGPTLINYRDIDEYAEYILKLRKLKSKAPRERFVDGFLRNFYKVKSLTQKQQDNPYEYGDNAMRYFRLTKYFRITKRPLGRWDINLEPARMKEIQQLLKMYDGSVDTFDTVSKYVKYLSDIDKPALPWELDRNKSKDVALSLISLVERDFKTLNEALKDKLKKKYSDLTRVNLNKLKLNEVRRLIEELRRFRLEINQLEKDRVLRRNLSELKSIITVFKDRSKMRNVDPIDFEYMISQCLKILNDELRIKPNYLLDDDGNPVSFAPGNKADIEGYYESFNSIFEVTLDVSRSQVYRESIPIMRHLRDFENKNSDKPAFCVFVAPKVHDDTTNYFWYSVKYGYEGKKQRIVALDLLQFVRILELFIQIIESDKSFTHSDLMFLLESVVNDAETIDSSVNWFRNIDNKIEKWEKAVIQR